MKKIISLLVAAALALGVAACGIGNTNTTYARGEIGRQGAVEWGKIIAMTNIEVEGQQTGLGLLGGGALGGVAGHTVGSGHGQTLATIAGGIGGAVAGNVLEKKITADTACEFIVQKTNGQTVPVVQTNELGLKVDDEVLLSIMNGKTRIRQKL